MRGAVGGGGVWERMAVIERSPSTRNLRSIGLDYCVGRTEGKWTGQVDRASGQARRPVLHIMGTKMTESSMAAMRADIARTYQVIRPYIRRTPVVEVDAADFGLDAMPLVLKLESMQHTGSFKTRGAFSNLLTRAVPAAGVVAASGEIMGWRWRMPP